MVKVTPCPLCHLSDSRSFWAMPGYQLNRCSACSFVWDPFPPPDITTQYQENYFINSNPKGGYANYFEGMRINRLTFHHRLLRLKRQFNTGRLLDIGCALGDCLLEARKLGYRHLLGLDTSAYAIAQCHRRRLPALCGTLDSVKIPASSRDIILAQDVVEHLPNPLSDLKKIYRLLVPGGHLFIVTPEVDGFWHRLLGPLWYHFKPGEHVVYFSQATLTKALLATGFTSIITHPTYHIMSVDYIFRRLRYYSPFIFDFLLSITPQFIKNIPLRVFTGEFEALAQKPLSRHQIQ